MDTVAIYNKLLEYERDIQRVIALFREAFGEENPCDLWRRGKVNRVGELGGNKYEYSLHGFGCTVDLDGKLVSFDFHPDCSYVYSPFKFSTYLDDKSVADSEIVSTFETLCQAREMQVFEGKGVRMTKHL